MAGSDFARFRRNTDQSPPESLYTEARWYACYTRARSEKQVARLLSERKIESFLPLVPRTRQWKDRRKLVDFPLFPSYVFGRFTLRDVHAVLTTPGVSTIVRANGYPTPIPDSEIESVRRVAEHISATGAFPQTRSMLTTGQRVRVTDGPCKGVEGFVIELRGRKRVLVGIAAIGQGLEFDIDVRLLEPAGKPVES